MPYAEIAAASGTVASDTVIASVRGQVARPVFAAPGFFGGGFVDTGPALAVVTGTVSRVAAEAIGGRSVAIGARIKLDGAWVPEEALAGPVEISDSIDTHRKAARFTLAGREWSVFRTLATWTRVPVEIWFREGAPGADLPERLEFRGWLIPGSGQTAPQLDPVVSLQADDTSLYDDRPLCHEVEPYAGLTRGEIARELALDVGIDQTSIPAGAVYNRPLFTDDASLFGFLRDFGEPEGWRWRLDPDPAGDGHVLVAYAAEIKAPPQAPDHVWTLDDVDSVEVTAPERPASRYVVRGMGAVIVDEVGERVSTQRVWIDGPQPPKVATHRQLADGTIEETGIPPIAQEGLFPQIELLTENVTRNGLDVRQYVKETGWYNPAAARLVTTTLSGSGVGGGPVDGYYFAAANISEDGSYVALTRDRWLTLGERWTEHEYDATGKLLETIVEEARWHRRSRAVRDNGDTGTAPTVALTGIGDDDQSWRLQGLTLGKSPIETYGKARRLVTEYLYSQVSGAVLQELSQEHGWHSPRATVDPAQPYHILYGGHAQRDLEAVWEAVAERGVNNVLTWPDARILGTTEWANGWTARRVPEGTYDWGDGRSFLPVEAFTQIERKHTQYWGRPDGSVEEITLSSSGPPSTRILARAPLPRFRLSPWTVFRQQPVELTFDDEVLEELFGFRREVLAMDHVLDLDEARRVMLRRRRDATSRIVTVRRFEALARPGDTVLLLDPVHGIAHRGLLADRQRSRDLARPDAPAVYTLRVPM